MIQSIATLMLDDDRARWRAILWSWGVGSIAGAIAATSSNMSIRDLAFVTGGFSLAALGIFIVSYSLARIPFAAPARRNFLNYAYASAAAMAFTVFERLTLNPETVHAEVVRIGENMDGNNFVPSESIQAARIALDALEKKNRPALKDRMISDYSIVIAAAAYNEALQEVIKNPNSAFRNMALDSGGVAVDVILILQSSALLYRTRIIGEPSPRLPMGIDIVCRPCSVVFLGCELTGVKQRLDLGTWFRSHFIDTMILYDGGSVVLFECLFERCSFVFGPSVTAEMRSAVTSGTTLFPLPSAR